MPRILSESADFQLLEALRHNRRKRTQRAQLLIEGVQPIERALDAAWPLRSVVRPDGVDGSSWATATLDRAMAAGAERIDVRPDLFGRLVERDDPPELFLVGAIPTRTVDDLALPADGVIVAVDRPASPGNLGTILRTSDALGAAAVITVGHGAQLWDPRTVRASVGSVFSLPAVEAGGPEELASWLARWREQAGPDRVVTVCATDEDGDLDVGPGVVPRPALVLLGTERTGLSRGLRDLADVTLRIPMAGSATSLNVAVAHGIVLHAVMTGG